MNNVHSRDGFYCELLLCLLISYNKFTLSNIGFLLTVDGNFRWQYKDLVACLCHIGIRPYEVHFHIKNTLSYPYNLQDLLP